MPGEEKEEKEGENEEEEVIYDVAETQESEYLEEFKKIIGLLYNKYNGVPYLPVKDYRPSPTYNEIQKFFTREYKTFIKSINPENIQQMENVKLVAIIDQVIKKINSILSKTSSEDASQDFRMIRTQLRELLEKIQSSSGGKPKSKRNKSKRKRNKRKRNKSKRKRNK